MHLQNHYFFEIPIYRCSPDQFVLETENEKVRSLSQIQNQKVSNPENYAFAEQWFDNHVRYPWEFNEIVGYLRLYALGDQIRGDLWFMKAKRIRRGTKRKHHWIGKAFELTCRPVESNEQIGKKVIARVMSVGLEAPCEGRYIDIQCLTGAASALDWRMLAGLSPPVSRSSALGRSSNEFQR